RNTAPDRPTGLRGDRQNYRCSRIFVSSLFDQARDKRKYGYWQYTAPLKEDPPHTSADANPQTRTLRPGSRCSLGCVSGAGTRNQRLGSIARSWVSSATFVLAVVLVLVGTADGNGQTRRL